MSLWKLFIRDRVGPEQEELAIAAMLKNVTLVDVSVLIMAMVPPIFETKETLGRRSA
jgi:hypothetical protein